MSLNRISVRGRATEKLPRYFRAATCGHGMSLIELCTVIAILTVLAAVAIPLGMRAIASSQSAACMGQLRQIGVGLQLYLAEHQGRFPEMAMGPRDEDDEARPALNELLLDYVGESKQAFACPADASLYPVTGSSYHWNNLLNGQLIQDIWLFNLPFEAARTPVVFDARSFHSRTRNPVNYLFADGSADRSVRFFVE